MTTMYKQGNGWIVSRWDNDYKMYRLSGEMSYASARAACGSENCRNRGTCNKPSHNHEVA